MVILRMIGQYGVPHVSRDDRLRIPILFTFNDNAIMNYFERTSKTA